MAWNLRCWRQHEAPDAGVMAEALVAVAVRRTHAPHLHLAAMVRCNQRRTVAEAPAAELADFEFAPHLTHVGVARVADV